jgi:lipoyl(octanoyl) transferase
MVKNKKTKFLHLWLRDYKQTWDYQTELFQAVIDRKISNRKSSDPIPTDNYLIFVYHPHVYTLGKSGDPANLLLNEAQLATNQIDYYKINRGGDITYHGPGQIVGYPILDLDNFFTDIHKYLRYLEEAVILTLKEFGLEAGRIEGLTGVWLGKGTKNPRKICALGVKSSRWVTMHGFAFNVNTDLSYFDNIIPCGIDDKSVTSMQQELNRELDIDKVEYILKRKLVDLFEMELYQ